MEIAQLRYALSVVDHGTFTAAARACHIAQPSLSHAIRALERDLGVELFHRIGRHTTLTSAGEAFVPAAREVLRSLDTLRSDVDAVAGVVAGRLDVVALPTLAVDPVAPLVGAFRREHPPVTVRLAYPESTIELLRQVREGDSELGITELPAQDERIAARPLGRQELVAAFPPRTERSAPLDLAELARQPLVSQPSGTSMRDAIDAALATIGRTPTIAVETEQREALVALVLAGAGVAVLPRPMAGVAEGQGAVVVALRPRLWREIGVVHRAAPLSPAARAFLALALRPASPAPKGREGGPRRAQPGA
jgi:LysR family carnitine catabolism transcriptional activator